MHSLKRNQYVGAIVGLAVGDSLGAPFEIRSAEEVAEMLTKAGGLKYLPFSRPLDPDLRWPSSEVDEEVHYPEGFWTDDTSMMLCMADSLLEYPRVDLSDMYDRFCRWLNENYRVPNGFVRMGSGGHTRKRLAQPLRPLAELKGQEMDERGDGSLMRTLPVGLVFHTDFSSIERQSLLTSFITHNSQIAGWCCVVYNALVSQVLCGVPRQLLCSNTLTFYEGRMPDEVSAVLKEDFSQLTLADMKPEFEVVHALRNALWAFFSTRSFYDAMDVAIRIGGDTDTYAAIAGGIAGACYTIHSIPQTWRATVLESKMLTKVAEDLYSLNCEFTG